MRRNGTHRPGSGPPVDFDALAAFVRVAAHGGFGPASRATRQPKATLSRHVRKLEQSLGVRLIERGPRTFRLTEEGAALHARTEGLITELEEAGRIVRGGLDRPRGRLRVSSPVLLAHVAMGRIAASFAARYPDVQLEVHAEDRIVDLVAEGYDLAIRINPRPEVNLVGRCFLRDRTLVVAPPSLPRPPPGSEPEPARSIPAVMLAGWPEAPVWTASDHGQQTTLHPRPVLRLSSLLMIRDAVRAGAGAAMLPHPLVAEDFASGRLVSWGTATDREVEVWVLHTSRRLASPKVAAFVQFLCDAFPERKL